MKRQGSETNSTHEDKSTVTVVNPSTVTRAVPSRQIEAHIDIPPNEAAHPKGSSRPTRSFSNQSDPRKRFAPYRARLRREAAPNPYHSLD